MYKKHTRVRGFTLIELMITVAIASILLLVAVPSLVSFRKSSELVSVTNKVVASINATRGEAMKRGMSAYVMPLDNGTDWNAGWAAFVYKPATGTPTYVATAEGVIAVQSAVPSGIVVTNERSAPDKGYVMFDASGFSRTKAGGSGNVTVTIQRNDVSAAELPDSTRRIIVSKTGRVRVCKPASATDTNCSPTSAE